MFQHSYILPIVGHPDLLDIVIRLKYVNIQQTLIIS